ncbi:MAG: hypothetical protein HRT66_05030 [Flavobacteriaceae bacterium]|nr:hypothetical protein [Flavobacteriaceae bacterium]
MDKNKLTMEAKVAGIISAIVLIGFAVYVYIHNSKNNEMWSSKNEKRISIATISDLVLRGKTVDDFKHTYTINNNVYKGYHALLGRELQSLSYERRLRFIGKRYFVVYVVKDPSYGKILMNKPVLDSMLVAPANGWAKIPKQEKYTK